MAATKKAAAKKSTAKKAASKKAPAKAKATAEETESKKAAAAERRAERERVNAELAEQISALREEGKTWKEISDELSVTQGRAQLLLMRHEAGEPSVNPTPARIVKDRDQGEMSWPAIGAKYGISKAKVQSLYREAGLDPQASYIGKGGRYFGHEEKVADKKATAKTSSTKSTKAKSTAKAKAAKPIFDDPDEVASDDVKEKIEGKTVTWTGSRGRTESAKVKPGSVKVGKQKDGTRVVQFNDGSKTRTVAVGTITKVGK